MSRYGLNYYNLANYGTDNPVSYVATSFTARSEGYGYINLSWNSPYGQWSKIKLLRNSYGFPVNAFDGTVLDIKKDGNYGAFKETDPTQYDDISGLGEGQFYYYSLFVYETVNYSWIRVGDAIGLNAKDFGYTDTMYNYLPNVYKTTKMNDPLGNLDNPDLYAFLSLFGFQLNLFNTYTNLLVNRYDVQKVGGTLIPSMLQQFGIAYEPEIGYQQSRILVRDAVQLYKDKGSSQGLREFMKSFTGWAVPGASTAPNPGINGLTLSANLMLDYNDSSFEESNGHWGSTDGTATLANLGTRNVTTVALTSNVATITTDKAHGYAIGNKVYIKGSPLPLFNSSSTSPVTITGVTTTTFTFALTGTNVVAINAFNNATNAYPTVNPSPVPWAESTAPALFPNKQNGIMAIKNASGTTQTITVSCGKAAPITKGIPVTEALVYSFSVYGVSGTTGRALTLGIIWYDRFGVAIGSPVTSSVGTMSTGAFSTRYSILNKTAPTGATYAVPVITVAGVVANEWHYFDAAQFEQSATASNFDEARQIHMTLRADRINELTNPHFAQTGSGPVAVAPWKATNATFAISTTSHEPGVTVYPIVYKTRTGTTVRLETSVSHDYKAGSVIVVAGMGSPYDGTYTVTAVGIGSSTNNPYFEYTTGSSATVTRVASTGGTVYFGGNALELTATGASSVISSWDGSTNSQLMGIYYPSTPYTFSFHAQVNSGTESVTPTITWYNSSYAVIGSTVTGTSTDISSTGTNWTRPYLTATAPSNAAYASVGINWTTSSNGDVLRLDAALFENQSALFPFFDGSKGDAGQYDLVWEGSQDASRSHYYKNRFAVQTRLGGAAFTNQLMLGTTVAVYLAQPKT
jgi:hypothetical protein